MAKKIKIPDGCREDRSKGVRAAGTVAAMVSDVEAALDSPRQVLLEGLLRSAWEELEWFQQERLTQPLGQRINRVDRLQQKIEAAGCKGNPATVRTAAEIKREFFKMMGCEGAKK